MQELSKDWKELQIQAKERGDFSMRSCWNCNSAHDHLKKRDHAIVCFVCGHWYFKGERITPDEN